MTYCSMCEKDCEERVKSERERLISLLKKKSVFVVFPKLHAEIEQCSSEEHAHASKRRIEKG